MHPLISTLLAKPFLHVVVTMFDDGLCRRHQTRCAASAENHAVGERRKIGRSFIRRETGKAAKVIAVVVETL